MAWRRPGDKPLSEPMMVRSPTHICVTGPHWVNAGVVKESAQNLSKHLARKAVCIHSECNACNVTLVEKTSMSSFAGQCELRVNCGCYQWSFIGERASNRLQINHPRLLLDLCMSTFSRIEGIDKFLSTLSKRWLHRYQWELLLNLTVYDQILKHAHATYVILTNIKHGCMNMHILCKVWLPVYTRHMVIASTDIFPAE